MTIQAYIENVKAKTGKTSADWLKADFDHGRSHAMAIYATLAVDRQKKDRRIP